MRELKHYIEAAKARTSCPSDRQFAKLLGIGTTTLFHWNTGRNFPSDEMMTKIASLAGMDRDAALLDLNIWRAPEGLARSTYIDIARRLGKSAAALFLAGTLGAVAAAMSPSPAARAAEFSQRTNAAQVRMAAEPLYIMENSRKRRRRQFIPSVLWPRPLVIHRLLTLVHKLFMDIKPKYVLQPLRSNNRVYAPC